MVCSYHLVQKQKLAVQLIPIILGFLHKTGFFIVSVGAVDKALNFCV